MIMRPALQEVRDRQQGIKRPKYKLSGETRIKEEFDDFLRHFKGGGKQD
jgi:hypothetical protein